MVRYTQSQPQFFRLSRGVFFSSEERNETKDSEMRLKNFYPIKEKTFFLKVV